MILNGYPKYWGWVVLLALVFITGGGLMTVMAETNRSVELRFVNLDIFPLRVTQTSGTQQIESIADRFVIEHVGQEYFCKHFKFLLAEVTEPGVIKATYEYRFEPHVEHHQLTMLLNESRWSLSEEEISVILLEPQRFIIDRNRAIEVALQKGLSLGERYEVSAVLSSATDNRFAWEVISVGGGPIREERGLIFRIVLDVESGKIYAIEGVKPMTSHGSPP